MVVEARAQSEVIGTVLLAGVLILSMSVLGTALLTNQTQQIEQFDRPAAFETTLDQTELTIAHVGGRSSALADLTLVIRQGDTETRYQLSENASRLRAELDGDAVFESTESVTVSHSFTGDVQILLLNTAAGSVLYDKTKPVPTSVAADRPTIERFEVTDTSSGGDASFNVTWNASDDQGDISEVRVDLLSDGTVIDTTTTSFDGVVVTNEQTDTVSNTSGGGEVYQIRVTVTDAAGNTVTASKGEAADSDVGIRSPVIERFDLTDVSTGNEVAYDYTYNASDPDGDLVRVTLELVRESDDTRTDNVTDTYSTVTTTGVQTGTLTDPARGKNDAEIYRITIITTDLEGNDDSAVTTDTADGDGGSSGTGSSPTIDRLNVTDTTPSQGKQTDASFDVTWEASDVDGNLQNATLELERTNGNKVQDTVVYNGSSFSSGSDTGIQTGTLSDPRGQNNEYIIRLIVTDNEGKTVTREETHVADGDGTGDPP